MSVDAGKLRPFLPPMDAMTFWRVLMGISAFSFWVFAIWFFLFADIAGGSELSELRKEQKEERIQARHRDFCRSTRGSEQAVYYLARRNQLITEYSRIDGERFDSQKLPPCEMVIPEQR